MQRIYFTLAMGIGVLGLGSVVAFAQSAPTEASQEQAPLAQSAIEAPSMPIDKSATAPEPTPEPQSESEPIEDAPIDVPTSSGPDWAPDINLDAPGQSGVIESNTPQRRAKPRKVLSDAGETVLGSSAWSSSNGSEAAQAQLLSRANRRERAVDPVKRSELTKLSRVMGALHALRVSCSGRDDQTYRSRMATLLDLEAPGSGGLRDPLVDAFNGGFQAYGRGAGACPADARVQEAGLAKEGYTVARNMSVRYRPAAAPVTTLPPATQPRQNAVPVAKKTTPVGTEPLAKSAAPTRASWSKTSPKT
jgi:uncharacterized protein (TIGR02301 family)